MEITIHHVFQGPVLRFLDALTGGLATTTVAQSTPTTESPVAEAPVEEPKPEPKAKRSRAKKEEAVEAVAAVEPVAEAVAEEPAATLEDSDDLLGEDPKPEKSKLTIDDFRRVCKTICEQGKEAKDRLREFLMQWDVKQIPAIPPEKFDVIWADLKRTFPGVSFE